MDERGCGPLDRGVAGWRWHDHGQPVWMPVDLRMDGVVVGVGPPREVGSERFLRRPPEASARHLPVVEVSPVGVPPALLGGVDEDAVKRGKRHPGRFAQTERLNDRACDGVCFDRGDDAVLQGSLSRVAERPHPVAVKDAAIGAGRQEPMRGARQTGHIGTEALRDAEHTVNGDLASLIVHHDPEHRGRVCSAPWRCWVAQMSS